jgi:glycosyltransferase involved in cell wall biosynthesis
MEVSVIIPTYNSARYLADAVDSVLAQTFKDFEVLVIDDGSTDETESLMRRYAPPVRYIRQANQGVAAARNLGIENSNGRYVAFLDADDTWFANKLERQISALEQHSEYRLCYSRFTTVTRDLKPFPAKRIDPRGRALEDLLLRGNLVGSICTVLCERSLFEAAGAFDGALSQCADWDMWVRLACLTEFLYLDEPLVTYRKHDSNMSSNVALLEHDSLRVLEKGFAISSLPESMVKRRRAAFARNYMVLAGNYYHARRFSDFLRCAGRAVAMDFRQVSRLLAYPARLTSQLLPRGNGEAT